MEEGTEGSLTVKKRRMDGRKKNERRLNPRAKKDCTIIQNLEDFTIFIATSCFPASLIAALRIDHALKSIETTLKERRGGERRPTKVGAREKQREEQKKIGLRLSF